MFFFSDIPWTALYQRPQHLAVRFAAREPLLWVEPLVAGRPPGAVAIDPGEKVARVVLPYLPYNAKNSFLRMCARAVGRISPAHTLLGRIQEQVLRRGLHRSGTTVQGGVAYLQNFQALHAVRRFHPRAIIYDCIDHPFGFSPLPPRVRSLWKEMVDSADLLIASSPTLGEFLHRTSGRDVRIVSNGVEFEKFSTPVPRAPDLPDDGMPIAGYVGSVYPWINFELLEQACQALPTVRFVVVGKEHPEVRSRLVALSRFPNFRFLGYRPYAAIPSYLQHFSAGLIPFLRTPLTEGVNPVKLYEYAAAGVPVVATSFSKDLTSFGSVLLQAEGADSFAAAIRRAIGLRSDPGHRALLSSFASENDWDRKAAEIYRVISDHINNLTGAS